MWWSRLVRRRSSLADGDLHPGWAYVGQASCRCTARSPCVPALSGLLVLLGCWLVHHVLDSATRRAAAVQICSG